jgi:NADH-quinone oxidoreductase subunit D
MSVGSTMTEKMNVSVSTTITELHPVAEDRGYDLYFGPAHPGSGNFGVKLKIAGEVVTSARADPGYLHRGFEKLMEYRLPIQNSVLSDRICVLEALNWNLIHAEAVEELMEIEPPERARYIRVIMAELSRIQSHFIWFGAFCIGTGFETGFKLAFGYRDYVLDLFEMITGGRVYPAGYICPGGVRRDFPEGAAQRIAQVLDQISRMVRIEEMENPALIARAKGAGVLDLEDAIKLGATGPVLRASGLKTDVRKDDPYEAYDRFDFEIPTQEEGDAYARYLVGVEEIRQSVRIIRQALQQLPEGEVIAPKFKRIKLATKIPEGDVYVRNEAARGEAGMYMVSDGGEKPYRVKIRGPSFLHMIPVLEHVLVGAEIADVPVIYWSLNVCPADLDR